MCRELLPFVESIAAFGVAPKCASASRRLNNLADTNRRLPSPAGARQQSGSAVNALVLVFSGGRSANGLVEAL